MFFHPNVVLGRSLLILIIQLDENLEGSWRSWSVVTINSTKQSSSFQNLTIGPFAPSPHMNPSRHGHPLPHRITEGFKMDQHTINGMCSSVNILCSPVLSNLVVLEGLAHVFSLAIGIGTNGPHFNKRSFLLPCIFVKLVMFK